MFSSGDNQGCICFMDKEEIKQLNIPTSSGCYQFLDKNKKIIYVGKAANLRKRILSYWRDATPHSPAKYSMLKRVKDIKIIKTDSEIEALLLEANLIKKYQPRYNIVLRDDKRYVYIKISTEEKWPHVFITRKLEKSGRYFGPFVSVEAVRETLKVIRKIWPFRSCRVLPKQSCLYYRIGRCPGVCEGKISEKDYKKIIRQIILFLESKKDKVIKELKSEIDKLENIKTKDKNNEEKITRLKAQLLNLEKVLAHSNILGLIDKYATDIVELAKIMGLPKPPTRIEGYDISNIFNQQAVGSMVVFVDGEASKKDYRKFKIKLTKKLGDPAMLAEVMKRRLKHLDDWGYPDLIIIDGGRAQLNSVYKILQRHKIDTPILSISKGEGLRSALAPDKIFFPKEKKALELPIASPALHIIKRVRDEAHRFAVKYHRQLKRKALLSSNL